MKTQLLRGAVSVVLGLGSGLAIAFVWSSLHAPPSAPASMAPGALAGVDPAASDSKPAEPLDTEAQALALWSSKLAEHAAEAIDEPWSSIASRKLHVDLEQLADERGFSLTRTDCRTTSCSATLRWPSYQAAIDGFSALLHAGYQVSCARRITLPEPDDPDQPYDATILFDCSTDRRAM
jgi:hypothetical protein